MTFGKILMKRIACLILFIAGFFAPRLGATTVASRIDWELHELRDAMSDYGRRHQGAIPYGDNLSVVACLSKVGVVVPPEMRGPKGELLDPWGNPLRFIRGGDDFVVILSVGEKSGETYFHPFCAVVGGSPFEAEIAKPVK